MNTKEIQDMADKLRGLTLGKPFTFTEFVGWMAQTESICKHFIHVLAVNCHLEPKGKSSYTVVHGKDRKILINNRLATCQQKKSEIKKNLNEWNAMEELLNSLKEDKK